MERDKRGRFVKKAQIGTQLLPTLQLKNGNQYKLRQGVSMENAEPWLAMAMQNPDEYEMQLGQYYEPQQKIDNSVIRSGVPGFNFNNTTGSLNTNNFSTNSIKSPYEYRIPKIPDLDLHTNGLNARANYINSLIAQKTFGLTDQFSTPKIKYTVQNGKYIDQYGHELNPANLDFNLYEQDFNIGAQQEQVNTTSNETIKDSKIKSAGMTIKDENSNNNSNNNLDLFKTVDKTKLANFLELARAGIGTAVNNKIAKRALETEKPFLQDVSESHRSVYGDYRAKVEGEKAAAQLRNMASRPITSDSSLQQQMMMEAQMKGQEYIDKGRAQDEAMIRQTQEVAWQQEKENQQQRQAAAMANKQAMLMSEKNKAEIMNSRDSANFSQVLSPLLAGKEQRLRNEGVLQQRYQDYYDNALMKQKVWNTYRDGLSESQKNLAQTFATKGKAGVDALIKDNPQLQDEWNSLERTINNEIIRRQALSRGAIVNPYFINSTNAYSLDWESEMPIIKKGGTIYKAKLTKRTKDNDRGAKSIEASKKLASRLLEKAIDSLYTYDQVEIIAKQSKKKRKYQAGGGLPFVNFSPVFATSEKGADDPVKEKKGEDLTTKDVLTLLKDMDGLPSDMNFIVQALQDFQLREDMDPLGISSSSVTSQYINLINKIKVAKFNREEYNQAFNQLKGNGGLNELAITSDGLVVGTNEEGDFKYFTPEQVSKGIAQKEGYQLLTNSNLLYLRANSSDAAFNHRLITVASNGVGIETVTKYITDSLNSLGNSENSEQGYVSTRQGELLQGLQDFAKAVQNAGGQFDGTVNDLYKYKYLTKTQAEQAKKAMQYIYQTLPENARALLKVKSDGSDNGALKLVETLISSKLDTTKQFDLDLEGGKTHKSTSNNNTKDMSDLETSLPLNILKDVGGVDSYLDIDRGDGIHMSVRGTQFNLIKTPNGEAILDTSISNMLHQSGLQSIVKDMRNIQFGDQKLSPEALSNITYNNTGITRAILPIKSDGSVNLELLEAYEKAEADIELSGDKSPENVKSIYEQYGISSLLNVDGTYNQSKFAPFMVTEGYTTDALSGLKPSDFVMEYRGDEDAAVALIQKCLAVGSGKNIQTPEVDSFSWYNPMDWFSWTDTIFKGVLYIPITNNVNTAVFGANQTLDYDEALLQEEKYQNFAKMSNQRSTGADLLNI